MSNYEYLQSLNIDLFHATLCGLMGIPLGDTNREEKLLEWLNKEVSKEILDNEVSQLITPINK